MANDLRARLGLKDGGPVKMADGGADLRTRLKLGGGGEVHMQDGGRPLKRGVSSLPGYGEGIDDPTAQALLNVRRNLGEIPRAIVGAKPYEETNPTGSYRAVQALMNAPTPAAIIPEAAQAAGKAATALSGLGALSGVVKPKGGNWLAGTVERGLKPFKAHVDPELEGYARRGQILMPHEAAEVLPKIAINDWIDTKLGKYIRNEMATPEDPVRALAERGVLHVDPETLNQYNPRHTAFEREMAGFPPEGMSQSPGAQRWEDISDYLTKSDTAGNLLDPSQYGKGFVEKALETNPWLTKVDPETPVYGVDSLAYRVDYEEAGFKHLIDELRNATNPDSGLPRSLQLSPDKLQKVTVPQAVELVDKINKWRAEQKATADLKRSQNAATVEYKAYDTVPGTTEPNQRGLRWVELRTPEITSADQLTPEAQARYKTYLSTGVSEEAALRQAAKYDESLAESLKYEGEVMGHCVGGYCPDVEAGRSRIYSLRDAKGEPHVTIEVEPAPNIGFRAGEGPKTPEETFDQKTEWIRVLRSGRIGGDVTFAAWWRQKHGIPEPENPPKISQIKGKANRAPKDEYLPFVQDFVRSGRWSDVGDLKNTGMRDLTKTPKLKNWMELNQIPHDRFVTEREYGKYESNFLADQLGIDDKSGMAKGGAVRISDNPDTMLLELMSAPRMQEGGSMDQFLGRTVSRGVSALPGYGQGKEDVQQVLKAKGGKVRFTNDPDVQAMVVDIHKDRLKASNKPASFKGKRYA